MLFINLIYLIWISIECVCGIKGKDTNNNFLGYNIYFVSNNWRAHAVYFFYILIDKKKIFRKEERFECESQSENKIKL